MRKMGRGMVAGRWIMVFLAVAVAAATACGGGSKPGTSGYATITPQQLQTQLDAGDELTIIDLREPELYRAGHIPGAKNIPFEQFDGRISVLDPDDRIALVCHTGPMGDVSGSLLAEKGYGKVSNLQGGMASWKGKLEK